MKTSGFSLQTAYPRSAGFVSAALGLISSLSFFLSFPQDIPAVKWPMFFFGIIGIVVSYILSRDVLDRFKNRELMEAGVTNQQARLAQVGTRFISVVWFFAVGLILAFLLFWLTLSEHWSNIILLICSGSDIQSCTCSFIQCQ